MNGDGLQIPLQFDFHELCRVCGREICDAQGGIEPINVKTSIVGGTIVAEADFYCKSHKN